MKKTNEQILEEIKAFQESSGLNDRQFGLACTKYDHNLIKRIRKGVAITSRTIDKIRLFMNTYSPEDKSSYSPPTAPKH